MGKVYGVLDDVDLFQQSRVNVERGVGDQERLGVQRHIEAKHMRHAPAGAQLGARQHGVDQLVGVQAALHQHLDVAAGGQLGGFFCRRMAVRHRDDLNAGQVDAAFFSELAHARLGADQHRHDQAVARGVHGAAQRVNITGMNYRAAHRRHAIAQRQQFLEAGFGVEQLDLWCADLGQAHHLRRCQHTRRAVQHPHALLVSHLAVEFDLFSDVVLAGHGGGDGQRVANAHRLGEVQHLLEVNRAGAGKVRAQQRRDQRAAPHAVRDHAMEQRVIGVFGVQVGRIGVARDGGKGLDVAQRHGAQQARALAQRDGVVGKVFDPFGVGRQIHGGLFLG